MRIDWSEPLSKRLVRRRFAETWRFVLSIFRLGSWCWAATLAVCVLVRIVLPETADDLSWNTILRVAIVVPAIFLASPFLTTVFPLFVHMTEKGVMFQMGSGGTFVKYDQIVSISFADFDGLRMFEISFKTKKGSVATRTAAASPEVCDEDVRKFLMDIGQAHLWVKK